MGRLSCRLRREEDFCKLIFSLRLLLHSWSAPLTPQDLMISNKFLLGLRLLHHRMCPALLSPECNLSLLTPNSYAKLPQHCSSFYYSTSHLRILFPLIHLSFPLCRAQQRNWHMVFSLHKCWWVHDWAKPISPICVKTWVLKVISSLFLTKWWVLRWLATKSCFVWLSLNLTSQVGIWKVSLPELMASIIFCSYS